MGFLTKIRDRLQRRISCVPWFVVVVSCGFALGVQQLELFGGRMCQELCEQLRQQRS